MAETIMPRATIAWHADEAAAAWVRDPQGPKPQNPFDANVQPEHHRVWACDFQRQLLRHSAPADAESGA
jgi:hypothetical protein